MHGYYQYIWMKNSKIIFTLRIVRTGRGNSVLWLALSRGLARFGSVS